MIPSTPSQKRHRPQSEEENTTPKARPTHKKAKSPRKKTARDLQTPSEASYSLGSTLMNEAEDLGINRSGIQNLVKFQPMGQTTSDSLKTMYLQLVDLSNGDGVIAESQKDAIRAYSRDDEIQRLADKQHLFTTDAVRNLIGPCPGANSIEDIVRRTRRCSSRKSSEAHWNNNVHSDILNLAYDNEVFREKLEWVSAMSAQIKPSSLLPADFSGDPVNARMVDYVLTLIDAEMGKIAEKHPKRGVFNHTYQQDLHDQPIAISIETKLDGSDEPVALQQLCTWAYAQLTKLGHLVDQKGGKLSELPFLPLLLVQGSTWTMFALTKPEHGGLPVVWDRVKLGSSDNVRGTYALIACLQKLGHWCDTDYRQWFKENALAGF